MVPPIGNLLRDQRTTLICLVVILFSIMPAWAQCTPGDPVPSSPTSLTDWQTAAGSKQSFEVASVKPSKPNMEATSNFPLGPGDVYAGTGGRFCATAFTASDYIAFAYKLNTQQRESLNSALPEWATTERFDIEAKGPTDASKDQMRLMVQSLLAERFKLGLRHDIQQKRALALLVMKNGQLGPQLQAHSDNVCRAPGAASASDKPPSPPSPKSGLQLPPIPCRGILFLSASNPGRARMGGGNVSIRLLAEALTRPLTGIDRPVFDRTNLIGTFDFSLEFSPIRPPDAQVVADATGPTIMEALEEQLGLKLESTTGPVDVVVVDRIEHLTDN